MKVDVILFLGVSIVFLLWPFSILFWHVQNRAGGGEYLHKIPVAVDYTTWSFLIYFQQSKMAGQSRIPGLDFLFVL